MVGVSPNENNVVRRPWPRPNASHGARSPTAPKRNSLSSTAGFFASPARQFPCRVYGRSTDRLAAAQIQRQHPLDARLGDPAAVNDHGEGVRDDEDADTSGKGDPGAKGEVNTATDGQCRQHRQLSRLTGSQGPSEKLRGWIDRHVVERASNRARALDHGHPGTRHRADGAISRAVSPMTAFSG